MSDGGICWCTRTRQKNSEYRRYNIQGRAREMTTGPARDAGSSLSKSRGGRGQAARPDPNRWGKGQVSTAREVLVELGLGGIALVGVAKGEERKPGLEQLISRAGRSAASAARSSCLHLIQQVRDEAHRFAITGHPQSGGSRTPHFDAGGHRRDRGQTPAEAAGALPCSARLMAASVDDDYTGRRHHPRAGRAPVPGAALNGTMQISHELFSVQQVRQRSLSRNSCLPAHNHESPFSGPATMPLNVPISFDLAADSPDSRVSVVFLLSEQLADGAGEEPRCAVLFAVAAATDCSTAICAYP